MASIKERLVGLARDTVERLFIRSRLRLGLIKDDSGDKRIKVELNPLTLPGLFEITARDAGAVPRKASIDDIRRTANGYLGAQEEAAKAAVGRTVTQVVGDHKGPLTPQMKNELKGSLDRIFEKSANAAEKIVDTEATVARNLAGLEAISAINVGAGVEDPVVFWLTSKDDKVCVECIKLHVMPDGITPRLWKLSEVSRGYHSRGDGTPSLLGLHPHCFVASTRLHTNRGLLTIEELCRQGGSVWVAVDNRIRNRRIHNNQFGDEIPGQVWLDRHNQGARMMPATHVYDTGMRPCVRIVLDTGATIEVSEDHEMWVDDDKNGCRKTARNLMIGDKVPLLSGEGGFGTDKFPALAELMGNLMGDGHIGAARAQWNFFGNDIEYGNRLLELARPFAGPNLRGKLTVFPPNNKYKVEQAEFNSGVLANIFRNDFGLSKTPRRVPERVWGSDQETISAFLRGLYAADGHSEGKVCVVLAQNDFEFLQEIQLLLSNFGLRSRIFDHGTETATKTITYADGSQFETIRKPCWRLFIGGWDQVAIFAKKIGLGVPSKQRILLERLAQTEGQSRLGAWRTARVVSINTIGTHQTYCLTEPMTNTVTANGVVTGQCRCTISTLLPNYGFDENGRVKFIAFGHDAYSKQ